MNKLSSSQRRYLRSQAHHLDPVVLIGKHGIIGGTIEAVNKALETRELIKIKFRENIDKKQSIADQISISTNCHVVGVIGHIIILFRQNSDIDMQNFQLPL